MTLVNKPRSDSKSPIKHSDKMCRCGLLQDLSPCIIDKHVSKLYITRTIWNGIQIFLSNNEITQIEHRFSDNILCFGKDEDHIKDKVLKLKVGEIRLSSKDETKGTVAKHSVRKEFENIFCQYDEKHRSLIILCEHYYTLRRTCDHINILLGYKTKTKNPRRQFSKQTDKEAIVEDDKSKIIASSDNDNSLSETSQLATCDRDNILSETRQLATCDHDSILSETRQLEPYDLDTILSETGQPAQCDFNNILSETRQHAPYDLKHILSEACELALCDLETAVIQLDTCDLDNQLSETSQPASWNLDNCLSETSQSSSCDHGNVLSPSQVDDVLSKESDTELSYDTNRIILEKELQEDHTMRTAVDTLQSVHNNDNVPHTTTKTECVVSGVSDTTSITGSAVSSVSVTTSKTGSAVSSVSDTTSKTECVVSSISDTISIKPHTEELEITHTKTTMVETITDTKSHEPPETTFSEHTSSLNVSSRYMVTPLKHQMMSNKLDKNHENNTGSPIENNTLEIIDTWFADEKPSCKTKDTGNNRVVLKPPTNHILQRSPSSPTDCKRLLTVEVKKEDITKTNADVIVNSLNQKLQYRRGLGRHIVSAAGSVVSEELQNYLAGKTEVPVTSVVVTRPGSLQCRYLFHAVGPRLKDYKDKEQCCHDLVVTIIKCLCEAYKRKLVSIAFPGICSGIALFGGNGITKPDCAKCYITALKVFELKVSRGSLRKVQFIDTNSSMVKAIKKELDEEWDRPFDFLVIDPLHNVLDVIVRDKDLVELKSDQMTASCDGANVPGITQSRTLQRKYSTSKSCRNTIDTRHQNDHDDSDNTGSMPPGEMTYMLAKGQLPGFQENEHIVIDYTFEDGVQTASHPRPGLEYRGSKFTSYLPSSPEGYLVLKLMQTAFSRKLMFTIGKQHVDSDHYAVTWAGISQKRNINGGPARFGYPDPMYLTRVRKEMARFGIRDPF